MEAQPGRKLTRVIPVLRLTRAEIESNMDLLKSQKTVVWYDAACMEDAQDMCALFARELPVALSSAQKKENRYGRK